MDVHVSYPHIDAANGESARLKRLPRIRVAQIVMDYLAYGWSPDEICRQHPHLLPSEVHAAMTYYFDHQPEVDAEIQAEWEQVTQSRSQTARSPFFVRMRAQGRL